MMGRGLGRGLVRGCSPTTEGGGGGKSMTGCDSGGGFFPTSKSVGDGAGGG